MGNLLNHAKKELELIGGAEKDEMQEMMNRQLLQIVEVFESHGHSGFSASYAINVLNRLLQYKPLKPLTGEDEEWNEVGNGMFQNSRHSEVFKEGKDGQPYWGMGKIFSDDGGETWWTGNGSKVDIAFPFVVPDKPEKVIL